jgi:predicted nucleic acid-binding protein
MNGIRISLDTNVILNVINKEELFFDSSRQLLDKISDGELEGVISTVVLSEILTGFYMNNDIKSSKIFKESLIESRTFIIMPVDTEIADLAAKIRSKDKIKLPDAIILATAILSKSTYLVSSDADIIYRTNYGIEVVNSNKLMKMISNL